MTRNKSQMTAPPSFLLATPIYGHCHNCKYHDTQTKTAVAEGSHTRRGGSIWPLNLLTEITIWGYTGNRPVGGRECKRISQLCKTNYSVPTQVQLLTGIKNRTIETGLDAQCAELKIERMGHSALGDAKILKTVCTMKSEEIHSDTRL